MSTRGSSSQGSGFERYLQGDSQLSRLYEDTATERPPAELDTAILARARDEAAARRRARGPFAHTWFVPVSLAAVLVLAVGLITFMYEQSGAPFAPAPRMEEQAKEIDKPLGNATQQDEKAILRKPETASEPSPARRRSVAPQEPAGAASRTPAVTPAPTTAPSQLEARELEQERPAEMRKKAGPADQLTPAAKSAAEKLSPEAWLRHIAELRERGKVDEAEASLAEFKKHYPDYPIEAFLK